MANQDRVGDMEINQDLKFVQLTWKLQRMAWCVMFLILLAALAGLLGSGPLSEARAGNQNSLLWVEYSKFERYQSPAMLKVHLGPGAAKSDKVRISVNREYVTNIELQHIDPEPDSVEVSAESTTYIFNIADPQKPATIVYHLEPNVRGQLPVRISLEGGPSVNFKQFFYP